MASLTIEFTVGAQTATVTKTFTDARAVVFLDDLIENYPEIDDGVDGDGNPITRPMTREEVANDWTGLLMAGQIEWAKGLEKRRLDAAVADPTDLEGN